MLERERERHVLTGCRRVRECCEAAAAGRREGMDRALRAAAGRTRERSGPGLGWGVQRERRGFRAYSREVRGKKKKKLVQPIAPILPGEACSYQGHYTIHWGGKPQPEMALCQQSCSLPPHNSTALSWERWDAAGWEKPCCPRSAGSCTPRQGK